MTCLQIFWERIGDAVYEHEARSSDRQLQEGLEALVETQMGSGHIVGSRVADTR